VIFINGVQVYCHNDKGTFKNYDKEVIISDTLYKNAPNDHVEIIDMKIEGNCLKIKFSASGCDGSSWNVKLIDSGLVKIVAIPIVGPPIYGRTLKLSLEKTMRIVGLGLLKRCPSTLKIYRFKRNGNGRIKFILIFQGRRFFMSIDRLFNCFIE